MCKMIHQKRKGLGFTDKRIKFEIEGGDGEAL